MARAFALDAANSYNVPRPSNSRISDERATAQTARLAPTSRATKPDGSSRESPLTT